MSESRDLKDGFWSVENPAAWLRCPHCGSESVDLDNFNPHNDLRPTVECNGCGACGYYDGL